MSVNSGKSWERFYDEFDKWARYGEYDRDSMRLQIESQADTWRGPGTKNLWIHFNSLKPRTVWLYAYSLEFKNGYESQNLSKPIQSYALTRNFKLQYKNVVSHNIFNFKRLSFL